MSRFNPSPFNGVVAGPNQLPKIVVPSFIGENGQVLNLLIHEGKGNVVRDQTPFNNHGTIFGASWIDGPFGWALSFNGLTNYMSVPDSGSLGLTTGITLEAWINLTAVGVLRRIFVKDTGFGWATYGLSISVLGGLLEFRLGGAIRVTAVTACPIGSWMNFAATWDSVSTLPRIYINNVLDATGVAWAGPIPTNALPLLIGNVDTLNRGFIGIFALPRIYNRVLTASERTHHFESTRAIFGV